MEAVKRPPNAQRTGRAPSICWRDRFTTCAPAPGKAAPENWHGAFIGW